MGICAFNTRFSFCIGVAAKLQYEVGEWVEKEEDSNIVIILMLSKYTTQCERRII